MEHVVYILGAGFSAPLGLPVMRDFLLMAKDLYFGNKEKYEYFGEVLGTIGAMHKAKSYYEVDLFNIEEILSILDMENHVTEGNRADKFSQVIVDVIKAYTPPPPQASPTPRNMNCFPSLGGNFVHGLFGNSKWDGYALFVCNLLRLSLQVEQCTTGPAAPFSKLYYSVDQDREASYAVVTLNYDRVIETIFEFIGNHCQPKKDAETDLKAALPLAKIHGSVDGHIVAPTWRKLGTGYIEEAWRTAYKVLSEATQIRIVGYSLPTTDTYMRYLLEAAILKTPHMKKIDIIGLDNSAGSLRSHWADLVKFKFSRFRNARTEDYLAKHGAPKLWEESRTSNGVHMACLRGLEARHEQFMQEGEAL